jgi:hypothetical protein
LVTHIPRVEIAHPTVHLRRRHPIRFIDHRSDDAGLGDPTLPQIERQTMVLPGLFGDPP